MLVSCYRLRAVLVNRAAVFEGFVILGQGLRAYLTTLRTPKLKRRECMREVSGHAWCGDVHTVANSFLLLLHPLHNCAACCNFISVHMYYLLCCMHACLLYTCGIINSYQLKTTFHPNTKGV
jgi:hypothetical protein